MPLAIQPLDLGLKHEENSNIKKEYAVNYAFTFQCIVEPASTLTRMLRTVLLNQLPVLVSL